MNNTRAEANCANSAHWLKASGSMQISVHDPSSFGFITEPRTLNTAVGFSQADFEIALRHLVENATASDYSPPLVAT
jgi:hypothetical protein